MNELREPRFIQTHRSDAAALRAEAVDGLMRPQAAISPKFFYDRLGSQLFDAITLLDEYYPTRTEASILRDQRQSIAKAVGTGATLLDLGAGNCAKALSLFGALKPTRYVAIDISVDFLRDALQRVQHQHPSLDVVGLGVDFSRALDVPQDLRTQRPVFFYPGSSIGNFAVDEAEQLLASVRRQAEGGGLLIGVDLLKPLDVLQAAYDDALGVTAAFNRNALRHLNRLIEANFDPAAWKHVASFNSVRSCMEMHLEARSDQPVRWAGGERRFAAGERIHTECSHKYTLGDFESLLRRAGFRELRHWTDQRGWFALFWAQP